MRAKTDRSAVDFSARNDEKFHVRHAERMLYLEAQSHHLALIEKICRTLFDRWCEGRNVVALAYLMHGWPLPANAPSMATRLLQSLRELKEFHPEALSSEEHALLRLIVSNA